MGFVQTDFVVDVSDLDFGPGSTNNTIKLPLTLDRSSGGVGQYPSAAVEANEGAEPFGVNVAHVSDGCYEMALEFNRGFGKIRPGSTYTVNVDGREAVRITVVYAYRFHQEDWGNIDRDDANVDCIGVGAPILSKTANKLWMAIFRTARAAWHNARTVTHYYFYKNKYLNDILQFTTLTHALPENSTARIEYDDNGRITEALIAYSGREGREGGGLVRAAYSYIEVPVKRYCGDNAAGVVDTTQEWVIDEIVVDAVTEQQDVVKSLGKIRYTRGPQRITIADAPKYNGSLSPMSAFNQLSHFRDYEVMAVKGYEVVAP